MSGRELLRGLLYQHARLLWPSVGLALLAALFDLAPYILLHLLLQALLEQAPRDWLLTLCAGLALAALLRLLLLGAANVLSHQVAFRVQADLRRDLARHLYRRPLADLHGRGAVLKKTLVDDVGDLEHLFAHALPELVAGLALPLLATLWLGWIDWRMTLASLALLPFAFFAQRLAFRGLDDIFHDWHRAQEDAGRHLHGYVAGLPTLKAYDRLASSQVELREAVHALGGVAERITRRTAIPYALFFQLLASNLLTVLPLGLLLHLYGSLDAVTLTLFCLLGAGLTAPLVRVLDVFGALSRQLQGASRIAAELRAAVLVEPTAGEAPMGLDIELRQVRFGHPGEATLGPIDLRIEAGRTTALVGPSGAGKSTLLGLIGRFQDVQHGSIRIGGVDLRALDAATREALFCSVSQDSAVLYGSLRDNLRLAVPAPDDARLREMLVEVGLGTWLAQLPEGLDTPLGEGGARLSGGERQRLAIARALLKDAPIVLLDEISAHADPLGEAALLDALRRLCVGRTVVCVAQRLAAVRDAGLIAVIENGRLSEQGSHAELLARSDFYRRQWNSQQSADRSALLDGASQ